MDPSNTLKTITIPLGWPQNTTSQSTPETKYPAGSGVQSRLDEAGFRQYLEGYDEITPQDLLAIKKGGRMRYRLDTVGPRGTIVDTKFRLGGILSTVDPKLRYIRLFNPVTRTAWSVQLQNPARLVRLWYMAPVAQDEILMFRKLLDKLDAGEIAISKK